MHLALPAALFGILAVASWLGVAVWKPWALRWKLIDVPNARSSHSEPTLRAGGVPLVLLTLASLAIAAATGLVDARGAMVLAITGAAIAVTGFIDDIRSLGWGIRFAIQLAVAAAVILAFEPIRHIGPIPTSWLAIPLTILWIAGLTNAYNFMDGIDGIAGIQAVVAACGWTAMGMTGGDRLITITGIVIAATAIGFLIHNWPPATIFMGDVASGFLGFVFAALTVVAAGRSEAAAVSGVLFVWPFLFDTIVTFLRRLRRGENVFAAHRSHLYQRLVIAGASHRQVSTLYGALALLCTLAGVAVNASWPGSTATAAGVATGTAVWLLVAVTLAEKRASAEPAQGVRD